MTMLEQKMYKQTLKLNSIDRSTGTSSFFTIVLSEIYRIKAIKLKKLSMFNTVYNVISGYNDKFDYLVGVTNYSVTMVPGFYSISDFMTALVALINAQGHGLTFSYTYSTLTLKVTLSATGIFNIKWLTGTNTLTNIRSLIGFSNTDVSGLTTYTGSQIVNMLPYSTIYLSINSLTPKSITSSGKPFTFYIDIGESEFATSILDTPKQLIELTEQLSMNTWNLSLLYRDNRAVDLNGSEWSATLTIFYHYP